MAEIKSLSESRADPSVNHEDADRAELRKRNPTPITTILKVPLVVDVNLGSGSKTTSIRSRRGSKDFHPMGGETSQGHHRNRPPQARKPHTAILHWNAKDAWWYIVREMEQIPEEPEHLQVDTPEMTR